MSSAAGRGMQVGSLLPVGTSGTRVQEAHEPGRSVELDSVAGGGEDGPVRTKSSGELIRVLKGTAGRGSYAAAVTGPGVPNCSVEGVHSPSTLGSIYEHSDDRAGDCSLSKSAPNGDGQCSSSRGTPKGAVECLSARCAPMVDFGFAPGGHLPCVDELMESAPGLTPKPRGRAASYRGNGSFHDRSGVLIRTATRAWKGKADDDLRPMIQLEEHALEA